MQDITNTNTDILSKIYLGIKQRKSFLKSVQVYLTVSIIEKAIPLFLLPVLTRLLTPFDYGIIATFNVIRINIEPVIAMATSGAVCRAYYERDKEGFDFHSYLYNAFAVNILFFLLVITVIFYVRDFIPGLRDFSLGWIMFIAVFVLSNVFSQIKIRLWIHQNRSHPHGIYRIAKIIVNVSLSLLLVVFFFPTWEGRLLGIGITEICFCLAASYLICKYDRLSPVINLSYIKDILKFGIPLIPHSFGWALIWSVDKYFLIMMIGVSAAGVYGVALTIASILPALFIPFDMAVKPIIYEKLSALSNPVSEKIVIYTYLYFAMLIFIAAALWLALPLLINLFLGQKFYGAYKYMSWLLAGYVSYCMYRLFSFYVLYSKKTYLAGYITFTAGIAAIAANYSLIKINGAIGAAQATFIAYTTSFILTWWTANRLYPMPWFSINLKKFLPWKPEK